MKYLLISIVAHSLLFIYFYPQDNVVSKDRKFTQVSEIKVNLQIIQLKDEEKPSNSNTLGNLSSDGKKGKVSVEEGIEYMDVQSLKMKYFSFYMRAKGIIDYNWKKTLIRYFPKEKKINVYFELMKEGYIRDVIIVSSDEKYTKELMKNFASLNIPNPPEDLFFKSGSMYLRWVFETK